MSSHFVWKSDYVAECENCGCERRVMDCAELGDLCGDCFPKVMEDNFPTEQDDGLGCGGEKA